MASFRVNTAIFVLVIFATNTAFGETTKYCENAKAYDGVARTNSLPSNYYKSCNKILEQIAALQATVKTAIQNVNQPVAAGAVPAGQGAALNAAAQLSAAGSTTQQRMAGIASFAAVEFDKLTKATEDKIAALDNDHARALAASGGIIQSARPNYENAYQGARHDLTNVQKITVAGSTYARSSGSNYANSASYLQRDADARAAAAAALNGDQSTTTPSTTNTGGVSKNTKVALVGAGLIAAGTVVGLGIVASNTVNKANKAAEARISQAEAAAKAVIAEAEAAAKRLIDYVKDSADHVLTNIDDTVAKIFARALDASQDFSSTLSAELSAAFTNLSTEQVQKLQSEMNQVFDKLIEKATAAGNTSLIEKLNRAKQNMTDQFTAELNRRGNNRL